MIRNKNKTKRNQRERKYGKCAVHVLLVFLYHLKPQLD